MLPRIFMFVLVMLAAFYGRRLVRELMRPRSPMPTQRQDGPVNRTAAPDAEDLVKCATCGSYVTPHGPTGCGRSPCPYGG